MLKVKHSRHLSLGDFSRQHQKEAPSFPQGVGLDGAKV